MVKVRARPPKEGAETTSHPAKPVLDALELLDLAEARLDAGLALRFAPKLSVSCVR
jgi:hypothetical protein